MKSVRSLILILLLTLTAAVGLPAEDGWRDLFKRKDLAAWKANAIPDSWSVVDRTICAHATRESTHLILVGDKADGFGRFTKCEVEFMALGETHTNSGVRIL